ncbi:Shedu anti-phage system protein SduA domain-containing protein [Photobacterium phosphoreum]|uniref:Shedu anti-phage system protein SduA domain-containing protein n=1 Tax=Photobacterium phosphoreum TaxID=659 RepID=UPI0015E7A094|nr:Shedu anti-phage system protein SduA domain-containing protein [Photobacterium phosphoreum]
MTSKDCVDIKQLVMTFLEMHMKEYISPMYHYVKENPELIKTVPGFLMNPRSISVYLGRTHIGVEFDGPEFITELESGSNIEVKYFDYSVDECNLVEKIIGFEFDSTRPISLPLPHYSEDIIFPTNRGFDKLRELKWNFSAQNSIMGLNVPTLSVMNDRFTRVINAFFFDADESGLITRQIKWLDLIPIKFDSSDPETDIFVFDLSIYKDLVKPDAHYVYPAPDEFKYIQLPKINRFIELWGNKDSSEVDITNFISEEENQFILSMKFGATAIHSELTCDWQSEDRKSIRPDFFVVQPNGYADIVEFKLPHIPKSFVVGSENRETFSAWLNSYISQTRAYVSFFDDPNNRRWFEDKYGFKVHKPKRYLVVGRRYDFKSDVWREIQSDFRDLEIITFDDLIDGVKAQFYQ